MAIEGAVHSMIQFDVEPGAAQIVLRHGAQHCGFLRTADQ
jgi:hypothetical protein